MLKIYAIAHSDTDRHEAARLLLRWKYEEVWERSLPEIVIGERGKPTFREGSARFSISHTKGASFCALCDSEIGLDVERMRSVSATMAQKVLSREEWELYSSAENPTVEFLRFWTLKEAYFKFTGEGIHGDLRDIVFDLSESRPVLLARPELQFWSRQVGDFVISACADAWHRPELYMDEVQ